MLSKEQVRQLALDSGFELKDLEGGVRDLKQYVYDFAEAIQRKLKGKKYAVVLHMGAKMEIITIFEEYPSTLNLIKINGLKKYSVSTLDALCQDGAHKVDNYKSLQIIETVVVE